MARNDPAMSAAIPRNGMKGRSPLLLIDEPGLADDFAVSRSDEHREVTAARRFLSSESDDADELTCLTFRPDCQDAENGPQGNSGALHSISKCHNANPDAVLAVDHQDHILGVIGDQSITIAARFPVPSALEGFLILRCEGSSSLSGPDRRLSCSSGIPLRPRTGGDQPPSA